MKKILLVMSVAILMALFSAPSNVKADMLQVGSCIYMLNGVSTTLDVYASDSVTTISVRSNDTIQTDGGGYLWIMLPSGNTNLFYLQFGVTAYIPTLNTTTSLTRNNHTCVFYNSYDSYIESLPDEFRPEEPSFIDNLWDAFYDFYELLFGFRPMPGSIYDLLRGNADGDDNEITFPTLTPSPTPTPTPTPIPVQTIFVPDGNGNTTIIYQYPDPTTGVITQSPYNPNIENNITVNCDCDGDGGGSGTFTSNPQDPYTLDSSLLWADGFGVEISENPLQTVNESQQSLNDAAMQYDSSVNVLSNAYNILPIKWIVLVGILGGILIIAGLIRTFLGG